MTQTTVSTETELAADIAAGLRCLAVLVESNPDLAKDMKYCAHDSMIVVPIGDERVKFARWARAAKAVKAGVTKDATGSQFMLLIDLGTVRLKIVAPRDEVCERVVVGTETVTKTVKDPVALAGVPDVEVTEQVEQVEWVCRPLLAESAESAESRVVPALAGSAVAS